MPPIDKNLIPATYYPQWISTTWSFEKYGFCSSTPSFREVYLRGKGDLVPQFTPGQYLFIEYNGIYYPFNGQNRWWAWKNQITTSTKSARIEANGLIKEIFDCNSGGTDSGNTSGGLPKLPSSIPSPTSNLIYSYFVLENLSRSKKIFAYYSGSQNFNYTFSTDTTSADPGSGFFRLNQGPEGTGGNEDTATEMYIDIKDNQEKEDIITYLTSLSSSLASTGTPATPYGELQLFISGSSRTLLDPQPEETP